MNRRQLLQTLPAFAAATQMRGQSASKGHLKAGLVDTMHLAISPLLLGSGESLLGDLDLVQLGYRCTEHLSSPAAMHVVLTKV